ncbi:MAG: SLC13 family permease [Gammaproteobacteria bacterium]|nr:SLC13 family permease [Gammaproteobacteria bacterium]
MSEEKEQAGPGVIGGPSFQTWRWVKIALGPALFLLVELLFRPDPGTVDHPELVRHALGATLWIAAWWFTEALPIPATSLLPIILFPLLGLATTKEVAREYGHDIIFLFLGGFLLAIAMERTGLQERIAIRIIRIVGQGRRTLVLGFMVATAVLSMWISNTATTVMLLPVALAMLATQERGVDEPAAKIDQPFAVALLLGIAYAANIGGLGTPVGSPPNLIFQDIYHQKTGQEVSFLQWMLYAVPVVLVLLPATWWMLVRRLSRGTVGVHELPRFGPMSWGQWWVLSVFSVTVALWISRGDFVELQGWGARLSEYGLELTDSSVAIAAAIVLFVVPRSRGNRAAILDWSVAPRLPWGVLLLMGAGFAISMAFDRSGLTVWIGAQLQALGGLPLPESIIFYVVLGAIVVVSILITEFASNTASASILLPIIFGISAALGPERFPPEILMVACAVACTTGFAVPAGTPPNALVFATERISIGRFVRIGLLIDLLAVLIIVVVIGGRQSV